KVYNAVALIDGGGVSALRYKHDLPNYGPFDEKRVFAAGPLPDPIEFRGAKLGVLICEDCWTPLVTEHLAKRGAEILIVPNGSPFERGKLETRVSLAMDRVSETGLPFIYVNQFGGQDELVFDGASFALGPDCELLVQLPSWREAVVLTEWQRTDGGWFCAPGDLVLPNENEEAIYLAMVTGLRDYVDKNRFPGVVLGMSGGIDSALSAAVAVDALGAERVRLIMLPYRFTSSESLEDANECASWLGARIDTVEIGPAVEAFYGMMAPLFENRAPDLTEENVQARARGVALMAFSNKFGHMVLTTGNKSEMSVGYATLYGDMCGGYSVLKDIYKTTVFKVAAWRNRRKPEGLLGPDGPVIPERIITKPPTAELRPNQTDQDSLPPYDMLDAILEGLVEREETIAALVAKGFDKETVHKVQRLLYAAEYKRRQAPPGVKITTRSYGRDRRYPLTNRFRDTT
ncbi:MAG: NAD+ synthase, partial [Alphaproteobacteria bacterium]|nr:NAD+ synthase [Alphaproteobacteria bacterium]